MVFFYAQKKLDQNSKWIVSFARIVLIIVLLGFIAYLYRFYSQPPLERVIIDPGHGGYNPRSHDKAFTSERWDELTQQYLSRFGEGMRIPNLTEAETVYPLAKRVVEILKWTQYPLGWYRFQRLLRTLSNQKEFPRIMFHAHLTRPASIHRESHLTLKSFLNSALPASAHWAPFFTENPNINNRYRLYDYRDMRGRLRNGRLSNISEFAPSLVVSLHMTPGGSGTGGLAAVLSPGYKSMNFVREIHLGLRSFREWKNFDWKNHILRTKKDKNLSNYKIFRSDIWSYFNGYRALADGSGPNFREGRGLRQNLINWAYRDHNYTHNYDAFKNPNYQLDYEKFRASSASKFWRREKSQKEYWRRENGPLGKGGDNYYASDELLRFVRWYALLEQQRSNNNANVGYADVVGEIYEPYVSSYALPIYTNAIVAYLELGSLDIKRDRLFMLNRRETIARAIAIGIYSLYAGLSGVPDTLRQQRLRCIANESSGVNRKSANLDSNKRSCMPGGQRLDFQKYYKDGNYFKAARSER